MQGILFNEPTGMLSDTIKGIKTKTRRLGGLKKVNKSPDSWWIAAYPPYTEGNDFIFTRKKGKKAIICRPRFSIGEIVYIKESSLLGKQNRIWRVDVSDKIKKGNKGWSNPMFEAGKNARHHIKILSIKVERLQQITEEDAISEGVLVIQDDKAGKLYKNYLGERLSEKTAKDSFASLIDKIDGRGTWKKNPWVWVYEYKCIKK
jgi:hypothetical protein